MISGESLVLPILRENDGPVDSIEDDKENRDENLAEKIELLPHQILSRLEHHNLDDGDHVGEEDEQEAGDNPDVQEGHVGDLRQTVPD